MCSLSLQHFHYSEGSSAAIGVVELCGTDRTIQHHDQSQRPGGLHLCSSTALQANVRKNPITSKSLLPWVPLSAGFT